VGNTTPWEMGLRLPNKKDETQQKGIHNSQILQYFHLMAFYQGKFQHPQVASP